MIGVQGIGVRTPQFRLEIRMTSDEESLNPHPPSMPETLLQARVASLRGREGAEKELERICRALCGAQCMAELERVCCAIGGAGPPSSEYPGRERI